MSARWNCEECGEPTSLYFPDGEYQAFICQLCCLELNQQADKQEREDL